VIRIDVNVLPVFSWEGLKRNKVGFTSSISDAVFTVRRNAKLARIQPPSWAQPHEVVL
jgi:hypothetical protein